MELRHGDIDANGISQHFVETGDGPLVVLCHGFPDSWFAWRNQLPALADAGYRAVAVDMRGYGQSDSPSDIGDFTLSHHVGDMVGLVSALGEHTAVIVGHDWGGPVAWYAALMRPDVFRAVAVLSTPYQVPTGAREAGWTNELMRRKAGDRDFYRLYFQEPGVAEVEHEEDLRRTVLGYLYALSGDVVSDGVATACWDGYFPRGERVIDQLHQPDQLPPWLSEEDLDYYASRFAMSGFRGPLNWYRNADRIPAILSPFLSKTIEQPSMFLAGSLDQTTPMGPWEPILESMRGSLPDLRLCELVEGAGHWLQQERAELVNDRLLAFLASLD